MEQQGLRLLMEDLAATAGATVVETEAGSPPRPGLLRIELEGARNGASVQLQGHLRMPGLPDRDVAPESGDPARQFQAILGAAGLRSTEATAILPRSPDRLLTLARLYGAALTGSEAEAAAAGPEIQALQTLEPRCAPAALAHAAVRYALLLPPGPPDLPGQADCGQAFDEALRLLPGFPRAAQFAGRFHTDAGDQRRALRILLDAVHRWPRSLGLRPTIAYAARTTGLLEGALSAIQDEAALAGDLPDPTLLARNAYLYSGQRDQFEASLGEGSEARPDAMRDFYRGYVRLLGGRRDEALPYLRRAAQSATQSPVRFRSFPGLALGYLQAVEGHQAEARLTLRNLLLARKQLRVPDAEFTFKIAEAFGFCGSQEEAMDTAQLAFGQGFGCTAWYESAPFLGALHGLPRWRALISHLDARQRLMEAQFPLQAFRP